MLKRFNDTRRGETPLVACDSCLEQKIVDSFPLIGWKSPRRLVLGSKPGLVSILELGIAFADSLTDEPIKTVVEMIARHVKTPFMNKTVVLRSLLLLHPLRLVYQTILPVFSVVRTWSLMFQDKGMIGLLQGNWVGRRDIVVRSFAIMKQIHQIGIEQLLCVV